MANYHNPNQLRASSSAFQWGNLVFTHYKTGCLRKILIQSRGVQAPVASKYGDLGKINEDRHAAALEADGVLFQREVAFEHQVIEGVTIRGHMDFLISDDNGPRSVDELKSVQSKNVRREVIKKGLYLVENLAQLCCYMSAMEVSMGRLIYTYYEDGAVVDERIFHVTIDEHYRISVDLKPTQYTIFDLYAHQKASAEVIATGKVGPRPAFWDAPFVSPCCYCQFASACDAYDQDAIGGADAFVDQASNLVKE